MKVPSPRHGWRAFAGEVGVIVLGVLIALGAQQAAEAWRVRQDVVAFRETIDREIGFTLFTQDIRFAQIDCDLRHVVEVRRWLDLSRDGRIMSPIYPAAPTGAAPYRGAWNSRDAETYRQLPADVRQKYAMFYDGDDNLQESRATETGYWRQLSRFSEPGTVSLDERRDAAVALTALKRRISQARSNIEAERQIARELGVKSIVPQDLGESDLVEARQCRPATEPPKS